MDMDYALSVLETLKKEANNCVYCGEELNFEINQATLAPESVGSWEIRAECKNCGAEYWVDGKMEEAKEL